MSRATAKSDDNLIDNILNGFIVVKSFEPVEKLGESFGVVGNDGFHFADGFKRAVNVDGKNQNFARTFGINAGGDFLKNDAIKIFVDNLRRQS